MTSESLTRRQREQQASEELAEALDAVSRPIADRVLGRAIELDRLAAEQAEEAANRIDYDTLRDIALEVGISEESLEKALLEELDTDKDHGASAVERITVPDAIRGGLIVRGEAEEVAQRLATFLEQRGLVGREADDAHMVWSSTSRGRAGPRGWDMESWTVAQSTGDRQLVELDVKTRPARKKAWRWILAIVILSMLFGNAIGVLAAIALWGIGMFVVVSWLKILGRRVRRAINRVLGALTGGDDEPSDWLSIWERSQR